MKKILAALAFALVATSASAKIANGPHDLSSSNTTLRSEYSLAGPQLSSCQFCHAPHNVNTAVTGAPLWNRQAGVHVYTAAELYDSNTLVGTPTLGANSLTCLSCHDGQTDMGSTFTGSTGFTTPRTMMERFADDSGYVAVGVANSNYLTDDHPVGVPMIDGNGTNGFQPIATATGAGLRFYGASNQVECGSCHDPHGTFDGTSGGASFLRAAADVICAKCHDK